MALRTDSTGRRPDGFTLLELMLVALILSTLSFMAIQYVQDKDLQQRFEDTSARLRWISKSVVHLDSDHSLGSGLRLGGYVVDNGVLPVSVQSLLVQPLLSSSYGATAPLFDGSPDPTTGLNTGTVVSLSDADERLMKGYRGRYLATDQSAEDGGARYLAFYDGWGNVGTDPDFGWSFASTGFQLTVSTLGADGLDNFPEASGYDFDESTVIDSTDWSVDIDGWAITVRNRSGNDLEISGGGCVRVSLLSYRQDLAGAPGSEWRRHTSGCLAGPSSTPSSGSCLDGDGDGFVGGVSCASEKDVFFDASDSFQPAASIPVGEHLLVLVTDDNGTAHDGSAGELPCLGAADCSSGSRSTTRVRFLPRYQRPLPVLEVMP